MKNLLNFKRLWTDSHEKQKMGGMRRYAAMLIMLLTLCVGQMWADSTVKGGDVYFDAGGSGWSVDNVQFVIGKSGYSTTEYGMTAVQNTLLYYYSSPNWNDASYFAFASGTSSWGGASQSWSDRCGWATKSTTEKGSYTLNGSNVYVFKSDGSSTCDDVVSDSPYGWLGSSGYSDLNKTITVAAQVSTDGGANYSSASSPGTLTASSYSFTAHGNNCKNSTSLSDGEIICGYTANTTLTAGVATGYTIMGWYDEDGEKLCNNGGTINPRADATVYAYYKLNQYTVSYGVNSSTRNGTIQLNSESAVSTTDSKNVNHGTSITFTAAPSTGYQVEGWYSDAACSSNKKLQPGGTSYSAGTLTAAITVYVKFETRTGGTVTLSAGTGGQVSLDGSSWGSSKAKSSITTATAFNIYAQANTGYSFSSWAKSSGSGTIASTSSASTSFTPVAYEDATVTASFTENKHNVTVQYRCGTAIIKSNTTASNVGEVTPSSQAAPAIDGYTFSTWAIESGVTRTSGYLTDATLYFKTNSSGTYTITAKYTANACNLTKLSAAKNGSETDKGAMTFDETTKAYYKDVTTDAGPYYFRFTMGSAKYCSDWKDSNYDSGKAVGANTSGSKVDCDQDVSGWGDKPAMYYPGTNGSKIRIWFDYQNKKVWTTADLDEQYVLRGSIYDESGEGGMPGWGATTSYFDGLESGNTGTYVATLEAGTKYKFKIVDFFTDTWHGKSGDGEQEISDNTAYTIGAGGNFWFTSVAAGPYVFTLDKTSGTKIKVKFPPSLTWTAASIYSGSATITASVGNVVSGKSLKYELFAGSTATGVAIDTYNTTTSSTSDSHSFTVTPSFGGSDINKTYTVKITYDGDQTVTYTSVVGRKWDIYVHDVQSWGGVKLHKWGDYGGGTSYPGDACSKYNSTNSWYLVTIDGKCNSGFVLSKSTDGNVKTVDLTPSITTYPAGSYYYISYADSKYGLTSTSVSNPTVTLSVDKINVNQITVTGTVENCGGDGTTAADMKEVGFYLGETKYTASYKSGTTFTKTITSLTANTTYSVKAYAINVLGEGKSSATSVTTLANSDYTIKIQVPHNATAPKVYAWTDADSYGGSKMENGTYGSQDACALLFEASTYDWYSCDLNNKYEKFLIYKTGDSDKSEDFTANREADCYWYNPSNTPKAAKMDCPMLTPHLAVKTTKGGSNTYYEMSESEGVASVEQSFNAGTYYIKVVYNTEYYGKGSDYENQIARTGNTTSNEISGTSTSGGEIEFVADFDGNYTFEFKESDKDLSVTYPTAYTVTYSKSIIGTDNSTTAAPTATYNSGATSVTSTHYVPASTSVTFDAKTAGSGYTWKGWYKIADPSADYSANKVSANANCSVSITKDTTIYAVYEENKHDVAVLVYDNNGTADEGGTVSPTSVNIGIATQSSNITATIANEAWRFKHWIISTELAAADGYSTTTNPVQIKTTATYEDDALAAIFEPRYGLVGSLKESKDPEGGMPGWGDLGADFDVISFTSLGTDNGVDLECSRTLLPNKTYKFQVKDRVIGGGTNRGFVSEAVLDAGVNAQLDGSADVLINTVGYGTYTFKITKITNDANRYPSIEVERQASYQLTLAWEDVTIDGTANTSSRTTYGEVTAQTDEGDEDGFAITNGQYFASGSEIVFTAVPVTGYELEGWYNNSDYAEEHKISTGGAYTVGDNTLTVSSNKAALSVYAKFVEKPTTVTLAHTGNGQVEISSATVTSTTVGVTTTRSITAVPDEGYYFAGWTVAPAEGADYTVSGTGEANTTITVTGLGGGETEGQTLTANFVELDKIYFRNENEDTGEKLWDVNKMYVYYNVNWGRSGASEDGVTTAGSSQAEMNPISAESNIYWAYVPRSFTTGGNGKVAFSNVWMGTTYPDGLYGEFYLNEAVYRTDYNKHLNMYVPARTKKYTSNSTNYFDNGFWMKYDNRGGQDAGYYLKEGNKDNQVDIFNAVGDNSTKLMAKYRFQNTSNHSFWISNAAGKFYKVSATITNAACTNKDLIEDAATPAGFTVTPTSEGYYTFYIEQSGDTMKLSIVYPISAGDYRLDYTYETSKHLYSDVFKPDNASSTNVKKSVYVNPDDATASLKLHKCTGLDGSGNPNWTATGTDIPLSNFTNGKGVYEFDMAITDGTGNSSDVASVSLSNVKIYEGSFYIKTDYAPGGWVNYNQNAMELNTITFDKDDSKTFDYYFCKWIDEYGADGKMNVKCIIANDYNEQITDTLIGDDILGTYWYEEKEITRQYLAYAANVRFSYNSYTNELKRAYINGATDWQKSFLMVSAGSAVIKKTDGTAFDNNSTTLVDQNNWIYMIDVKAQEGARVKLTANYIFNYTDHIQFLIGEKGEGGSEPYGNYDDAYTQEILGGDDEENWHTIRVIYDFKTNKLISAWLADGKAVEGTRPIETDVLVIRNGQDNPKQIILGSASNKLTEVDTVYSALCLTKDYLNNGSLSDSERRFYWISFPYDVRISDIFGSFGEYGEYWIFQRYNGRKRAQYGFWAESSSNWEYITDKSTILKAFEGYVLTLDLDEFNSSNMKFWGNDVTQIYEYFPSMTKQSSIEYASTKEITIDQEGYECTIDRSKEVHNGRELGPEYDRTVRDSYWHLMGVPSYAQTSGNAFNDAESGWTSDKMPFFYSWNMSTNKLSAESTTESDPFMPMRAYLVQYSGTTITWNAVSASPSSIVARRQAAEDIQFAEFNLHLMSGEESLDHTYVRLTDDEDASEDFEFGHDLCKEFQNGANIYTMIDQLQVAGNSLPLNTTGTTIVPVGVKIVANGEYIFSMPDGTSGIGVVLVDNVLNTRTNLSVFDYTVTLSAGTHDGRFVLEISPVHGSTTGMENSDVSSQNSDVRKMIIDQKLFIIKGDKMYDARGAMVK